MTGGLAQHAGGMFSCSRKGIEDWETRGGTCRKIVDGFIMYISLSCNDNYILIDWSHIIIKLSISGID